MAGSSPAMTTWKGSRAPPAHSLRLRLHRTPLDLEQRVEPAGLVRLFHQLIGAAAAEERIDLAARQALIGLADRLVHRGERGARRRREAIAELGQIHLAEGEAIEAVGRRERHERPGDALADDAQ